MHFSSMAVSLLAQSVPLLAVGHLAGWKKREERSWLQSRRLRDALLMGVHDKKGMLFEKHVRFHGKHDEMFKKKRSGSARLVKDSASSEIPSDDREASVECDPRSKVTDSGIFGCGVESHCVESEESDMGGICVPANVSPSIINRSLQTNVTCVEGLDEDGLTCDCSGFDNTTGVGNYICTGPFCWGTVCGTENQNVTVNADGSYYYDDCYELNETVMGLESYCYSITATAIGNRVACEIKVNDDVCNSCQLDQITCPADSYPALGSLFDCTNTIFENQGNMCYANPYESFLGIETDSETGMPTDSETGMPTTAPPETGPPTANPDEMPSGPTSSGRSHTAKVPIVVSAAAAAWMASFGT